MEDVSKFSRLRVSDTPESDSSQLYSNQNNSSCKQFNNYSYEKPPISNSSEYFNKPFNSHNYFCGDKISEVTIPKTKLDRRTRQSAWSKRGSRSFDETLCQVNSVTDESHASSLPIDNITSSLSPTYLHTQPYPNLREDIEYGYHNKMKGASNEVIRCTLRSYPAGSFSFEVNSGTSIKGRSSSEDGALDTVTHVNSWVDDCGSKKTPVNPHKSVSLNNIIDSTIKNENKRLEGDESIRTFPVNNRPPPSYQEAIASISKERKSNSVNSKLSPYCSYLPPSYSNRRTDTQIKDTSSERERFQDINSVRMKKETSAPPEVQHIDKLEHKLPPPFQGTQASSVAQKRQKYQRMKMSRQAHSLELPDSSVRSDVMVPQYTNSVQVPKFQRSKSPSLDNLCQRTPSTSVNSNNFFCPISGDANTWNYGHSYPCTNKKDDSALGTQGFSLANNAQSCLRIDQKYYCNPYQSNTMEPFLQNNHLNEKVVHHNQLSSNQTTQSVLETRFLPNNAHSYNLAEQENLHQQHRRSSAQSLPDLCGPTLDALCPEVPNEKGKDLSPISGLLSRTVNISNDCSSFNVFPKQEIKVENSPSYCFPHTDTQLQNVNPVNNGICNEQSGEPMQNVKSENGSNNHRYDRKLFADMTKPIRTHVIVENLKYKIKSEEDASIGADRQGSTCEQSSGSAHSKNSQSETVFLDNGNGK